MTYRAGFIWTKELPDFQPKCALSTCVWHGFGIDLARTQRTGKDVGKDLAWIWHEQNIELAGIWHGFNFGQCVKLAWT
jgi:hypothetical protein